MGLACLSCGYENDATRVYCHKCGLRLERKSMAAPPTGFTPAAEITAARTRKPSIPWGSYFAAMVKLLILGVVASAVVVAVLPPPNIPPRLASDESLANRLNGLIEDSAGAAGARAFSVSAVDAGVWLATMVRMPTGSETSLLKPERLYLVPGEGEALVGLECALPLGLKVYFEGVYAPETTGGGTTLVPRRYSVGRLPLPGVTGHLVQRQFDGLASALQVALRPLSQASQIIVTPQAITLRWANQTP